MKVLGDPTDLRLLTADPVFLRAALEAADAATLLLVLVQFTGDRSWLERARPYISGPMSYQEKMPADLRESVRASLYDVLMEMAETGTVVPTIPDGALLREMLAVAAGEPVGEDYVAMMLEDLAPTERDPRGLIWRSPPERAVLADFHVVIVGAGMSGLCAAIRLQEAGIAFTVIEKNETVSGTWFENSYPGCGVDTPNHFYSYSFAPNHDWSRYFAKRNELWKYFERIADDYGVRPHIRFNTEVTSARYDEAGRVWHVAARDAQGNGINLRASVLVSSVGFLNRPKLPEIAGIRDFVGPAFHTAQWDPDFQWVGKRVALIGTGASGNQVGPNIASGVERLMVFQRSPHWVVPNPNYFAEVNDGTKWVLANLPFYLRWYRFQLFWGFSDGLYSALQVDAGWTNPKRSVNAINDRHRHFMERYVRAQLGDDSALLEKTIPQYPPYGKRILIDNDWYKMLKRPNVDLVTEPIERIVPEGIQTADGTTWRADAIVFATGFKASKMLWPMSIHGRGGRDIHETWGPDDAHAYLGMTVPEFPNFFILAGPNTGLAHGGNMIFMVECQVRHIMLCLREMIESGASSIEVRSDISNAYTEAVDKLHEGLVWKHEGVSNWYKNKDGRVFALSPWRLVDYWKMTSSLNTADYRLS